MTTALLSSYTNFLVAVLLPLREAKSYLLISLSHHYAVFMSHRPAEYRHQAKAAKQKDTTRIMN